MLPVRTVGVMGDARTYDYVRFTGSDIGGRYDGGLLSV